ncbi:Serine/threonine-protein phosphatase PGAM5, mitochondrial [Nymphon striatum]|nr:Serine/threonine-protein phosphatase PGAM5, mitochondrial [Nymphon striatum]
MGISAKIVSSASIIGALGLGVAYSQYVDKKPVNASWTTNYTPSTKWDDNWDKRDPKSLVKPKNKTDKDDLITENMNNEELLKVKPRATRHVILMRHGQYVLDGATDTDRYLTDLGRAQAKLSGQRLKVLGFQFSKIIASTMTRAAESAQIISASLPDVPLESCEMLREGAPIPPEPPIGNWRPEASQFYVDGARIEAAFRKYIHRADPSQKKIVMKSALQLPPEAWLRMSLNHCSLTWLVIKPSGRVILKSFGDSGHFPPDKMSTT